MPRHQPRQSSLAEPEQSERDLRVSEREPDLLKASEVARRFGISANYFYRLEKAGQFRHLLTQRPVGLRRYSRKLVERFTDGESTVRFGRGARA